MKKESVGVGDVSNRWQIIVSPEVAHPIHEEGDTAPLEWARDKLAMETELRCVWNPRRIRVEWRVALGVNLDLNLTRISSVQLLLLRSEGVSRRVQRALGKVPESTTSGPGMKRLFRRSKSSCFPFVGGTP